MKMFGFVKRIFASAMIFFGCGLSSLNLLECVSMNNQECKVRPEFVNINSNDAKFYPFSIKTSKCSSSRNNTNVRMQNCVLLMLLKIQMPKFLI